jgi:predicted dehydrogenase
MDIGVISTANIGRKRVIPAIEAADGARTLAIASREPERADRVATEHNTPRAYGSYGTLLADEDLDAETMRAIDALYDSVDRGERVAIDGSSAKGG